MDDSKGVLPGTLDLLILKAVSLGTLHGYGVLLRIQQISGGALQIQQGALYPALYRLERQGLIDSEWGTSDNNRRANFYRLTRTRNAVLVSDQPGHGAPIHECLHRPPVLLAGAGTGSDLAIELAEAGSNDGPIEQLDQVGPPFLRDRSCFEPHGACNLSGRRSRPPRG